MVCYSPVLFHSLLYSLFTNQVHNDFTVRVGLEDVLLLEHLAKLLVVVDLTVDAQDQLAVVAHKRLSTGVDADNGKTLVAHDVVLGGVHARPIRTAMSDPIRHNRTICEYLILFDEKNF